MRREYLLTPRSGFVPVLVPENEAEFITGVNTPMFTRSYAGMLFDFGAPVKAEMTMVRTPHSLQIAFFGPDGRCHTVHNAPMFTGVYASPYPTRWVVETPKKFYRVGDRLVIRV